MAIIKDECAYPIITTKESLIEFMKRKRKSDDVIFRGDLLPIKCTICGKMITDEKNRVRVNPKAKRIAPMHYVCAWESLFKIIYSDEMMDKFGR